MKILTCIQARMNSTRLPGKVMLPLNKKPLLFRQYERIRQSSLAGEIIVITSTDRIDNVIYNFCKSETISVYRGNPLDLLDRHYKAALEYKADVVIKIPSDCPLISPSIIDKVVSHLLDNPGYDYVSNLHPASYPDGNDVEAMNFVALEKAWKEAIKDFEREHTTPYLWENNNLFKIGNVLWETGMDYSMTHRWTIDYPEDYLFIRTIYEELGNIKQVFEIDDILELLERRTDLTSINSKYNGVNWYRNHLNELKTIRPSQTREIEREKIY